MRASPNVLSQYGTRTSLSLLLPLQVGAKLGDKKLVQYILRTQSKLQWVWGPVSSYNLDLHGIDSMGETGNDVMELCARPAPPHHPVPAPPHHPVGETGNDVMELCACLVAAGDRGRSRAMLLAT